MEHESFRTRASTASEREHSHWSVKVVSTIKCLLKTDGHAFHALRRHVQNLEDVNAEADRHQRHIELVEDVERVQSEAEEVVVAGTEDHLEPQDDKFREEKKIGSLVEDLEGEEEIQPRFFLKDKLCALGLADVSS